MNINRQIYWHTDSHKGMGEDVFRYCPLCGGRLKREIIDQRPRQVCSACGYVHFRNPAPTVSLLIIREDQILLGKRPGKSGEERWATPSGYIEFDEDFLTTAIREAREETGLEIEIAAILNVTDSFFPPEQHFLNVYLQARITGGQIQSGDDIGELAWFPLSGPFPAMAFAEDIDMIERCQKAPSQRLLVEQRAL
jgi:8-oxo-dGTP diphosphatase